MTLAWHFVADTLRDGSPVPPDGVMLVHPHPPVLCESGLHASLDPFDALKYAPGPHLCLVRCSGHVIHAEDKLVCTERVIVARMDATDLLYEFARMQALSVVHLWDPPAVVLEYLMTGDQSLRDAAQAATQAAARAAARAATRAATQDAARAAAGSAAWGAARGAAWGATQDAARAAAGSAAWGAAWVAARNAARSEFSALVRSAFVDYLGNT
jgi:hypothetical protein